MNDKINSQKDNNPQCFIRLLNIDLKKRSFFIVANVVVGLETAIKKNRNRLYA